MPFEFSRSRALRTTELYQSVWQDFERWCASMNAVALPTNLVGYVTVGEE